jgi:hypothetical protein
VYLARRRAEHSASPAVYFFPVSDPHHEDKQGSVLNLIDGTVVLSRARADSIEFLPALQLFHAIRARIILEFLNVSEDLASNTPVELFELTKCSGCET